MIEPLVLPVERYLVPSLPDVWFGAVMFALAMYIVLDGFDFGIGMLYATREDEAERETMLAAFGPVWDANEVWLVAFGTMLLAAFPDVYSRLLADNYLIALGFVLALLFRGVGPELREQHEDERWQRVCDRSFVAGSTLAPLLFGVLAGSWVFDAPALSAPALLTGIGLVAVSAVTGAAFVAAKTAPSLAGDMRDLGVLGPLAYLLGERVGISRRNAAFALGLVERHGLIEDGHRLYDLAHAAAADAPEVGLEQFKRHFRTLVEDPDESEYRKALVDVTRAYADDGEQAAD